MPRDSIARSDAWLARRSPIGHDLAARRSMRRFRAAFHTTRDCLGADNANFHETVPRSVLIVKLAAIGDVVMALPMVTALRAADPATRITWLCGAAVAPLLRCVEGIDEIIAVDDVAVLAGTRTRKAKAVMAAWSALRAKHFDLVITAHSDPRYRMLAARVRGAERRWLGERRDRSRLIPGRYHGDEYVRLVTGVDDHNAVRFTPPTIRAGLDANVAERIGDSIGNLVALAPGGARNAARDNPLRRWPLERYAALAELLAAKGRTIVLTGGSDDAWVRSAFAGVPIIDLIGATTLPGLFALYTRCAAVVTHDSGPMHLARLAGAAVVGLFGPTLPATFLRKSTDVIALWPGAELPCAPCYDGVAFAACSDNRCMQLIEPATVAARVDALLAR
jgi:heptosyltransferase II